MFFLFYVFLIELLNILPKLWERRHRGLPCILYLIYTVFYYMCFFSGVSQLVYSYSVGISVLYCL